MAFPDVRIYRDPFDNGIEDPNTEDLSCDVSELSLSWGRAGYWDDTDAATLTFTIHTDYRPTRLGTVADVAERVWVTAARSQTDATRIVIFTGKITDVTAVLLPNLAGDDILTPPPRDVTVTAADDLALLKDLLITDALPQEGNRARLMRIVDDPSLTFRTAYWPWSTQPEAGYPYPEPVPIRPVEASEKGNTASGLLTEIGRTSHSVVVFVPWTETNPAPHYSVRDVSYPSTDIPNTDVCLDASMESTKTMADVCNRVQVRWFSDDGVTERWLTNTNLSTEWPNPVGSKDIETGCLQLEAAGIVADAYLPLGEYHGAYANTATFTTGGHDGWSQYEYATQRVSHDGFVVQTRYPGAYDAELISTPGRYTILGGSITMTADLWAVSWTLHPVSRIGQPFNDRR